MDRSGSVPSPYPGLPADLGRREDALSVHAGFQAEELGPVCGRGFRSRRRVRACGSIPSLSGGEEQTRRRGYG